MSKSPLVVTRNLGLTLSGRKVLRDIDLTIDPGEIVTLLGPNGAGKSTLARLILGLLKPDCGSLTRRPGLRVGYVPQKFASDSSLPLTVASFLALGRNVAQARSGMRRTAAEGLADRQLSSLSGGETQRVLLARALGHEPDLLVLDEPAQGVDMTGQVEFYELIRRARDELGCAVLLISHDLHLVMSATDSVLCLNGHICCHGPPLHVSSDPIFLEMFGTGLARTLAIYPHHHDHHHHVDGSIAGGAECSAND